MRTVTRYLLVGTLAVILLVYLLAKLFLVLLTVIFCTGLATILVGTVKFIFYIMQACGNTSLHPSSSSGTQRVPSRKQ